MRNFFLSLRVIELSLGRMKRFVELKDLYFGKKMHAKALQLLKEYVSPFFLRFKLIASFVQAQ